MRSVACLLGVVIAMAWSGCTRQSGQVGESGADGAKSPAAAKIEAGQWPQSVATEG